jgi:serine/threonine protein phosphatase PrpC
VVADGVGGWSLQGVDAGIMARELVENVHRVHQEEEKRRSMCENLMEAVKRQ